jgi:hypothetical protein
MFFLSGQAAVVLLHSGDSSGGFKVNKTRLESKESALETNGSSY